MSTLPRKRLSRRDRDVRLGYIALGIGAVVFLAMAATNFVVPLEVLPRTPSVHGPVQSDNVAPRQSIQAGAILVNFPREEPTQGVPVSAVVPAVVVASTSGNDGTSAGTSGAELVAAPSGGGQPGPPGHTPPGPGSPHQPGHQGPASGLLDPAVGGVGHSVDGLTGGGTSPVTGPVTSTTDHVTDILDGLLSGGPGSDHRHSGGPGSDHRHSGGPRSHHRR